jgi:rare lipoprotein A
MFLLIAFAAMLAVAPLRAQQGRLSDSSAQALRDVRRQIERDRRSSDSLRQHWDRQWRLSDSLRVESMLVRMRSDSLRKTAAAAERRELELLQSLTYQDTTGTIEKGLSDTSTAVVTKRDSQTVANALRVTRSQRVSVGRTVSDSLTSLIMRRDSDTGVASYYAEAFHGRRTSSGEVFDMHDRTCAHRWLPFNTKLLVTNVANGRRVVVRVNDRGPWKRTRIIDLSKQAAIDLDMIRAGTARVSLRVIDDDVEWSSSRTPTSVV